MVWYTPFGLILFTRLPYCFTRWRNIWWLNMFFSCSVKSKWKRGSKHIQGGNTQCYTGQTRASCTDATLHCKFAYRSNAGLASHTCHRHPVATHLASSTTMGSRWLINNIIIVTIDFNNLFQTSTNVWQFQASVTTASAGTQSAVSPVNVLRGSRCRPLAETAGVGATHTYPLVSGQTSLHFITIKLFLRQK